MHPRLFSAVLIVGRPKFSYGELGLRHQHFTISSLKIPNNLDKNLSRFFGLINPESFELNSCSKDILDISNPPWYI